MSSNHQQQQQQRGNINSSANAATSAYTNVALSPPSVTTHTAASTTSNTAKTQHVLQSPPSVTNGTATTALRQRRTMNHSNNNNNNSNNNPDRTSSSSHSASVSISEVCTDTYQCLCLLPVYPNYKQEYLEYNYNTTTNINTNTTNINEPSSSVSNVRIRHRGEHYIDSFNDQSNSFTFGTNEHNGIWCNTSDQAGTIMSALVWCLLLYSAATVTALTITDGIPKIAGEIYTLLVCCSLACHAKTSLSDPGSIPMQAIPIEKQRLMRDSHSMCGQCQTFKPPASHHCRICNRCISKMDHHCPWMNNCVGVSNMKHFILFLIYTWTCASYSLLLFGWNYFFCNTEECIFHPVVVHLVRIMTFLAVGAFLFTSSMLMNVCYGIITGIGTIDRLKKKATNTMSQSDEEPIPLTDIFGIGPYYTWCLPTDPIFDEYDRVLGYTMPQRLDRERQLIDLVQHNNSNVNNSNDRIQSSPLSPLSSSPETELLSPV